MENVGFFMLQNLRFVLKPVGKLLNPESVFYIILRFGDILWGLWEDYPILFTSEWVDYKTHHPIRLDGVGIQITEVY